MTFTMFCHYGPNINRMKLSIANWLSLVPTPEILIMSDGREERLMDNKNIKYVDVEYRNSTPYLDSMFAAAKEHASNDILVVSTTDMVYNESLVKAISVLEQLRFKEWVACGRRTNADVRFDGTQVLASNMVHDSPSAGDYHIFKKSMDWSEMPRFAAGRTNTDTWINAYALISGIPLISLTPEVLAIHQTHGRTPDKETIEDGKYNIELAGKLSLGSDAATYVMVKDSVFPAFIYWNDLVRIKYGFSLVMD